LAKRRRYNALGLCLEFRRNLTKCIPHSNVASLGGQFAKACSGKHATRMQFGAAKMITLGHWTRKA
jgi:hypothetical protein